MSFIFMQGITKVYPGGVIANFNVNFDIKKGEVHGLLGENGAGKTTLMKILAGCLKPTKGEIFIEGKKVQFESPSDAFKYGIGMVHQHFTLIPNLTVTENLLLGLKQSGKIDLNSISKNIEEFSKKIGLRVDPKAYIHSLSVGERQRVEILRLLFRKANVLILDEPTSVLCGPEVEKLFSTLKQLIEHGCTIIFVTHKIKEALAISDRITIMRNGKVVATLKREEIKNEEQLVNLIIGEKVFISPNYLKKEAFEARKNVLTVKDLNVLDDRGILAVKNISFNIKEGEVFGIAGVEGNGQKELCEAIVGLRKPISGKIIFMEQDISKQGVSGFIKAGGAYIPAERIGRGIAMDLSVEINSILKKLEDEDITNKLKVLNWNKIKSFAKDIIKFLNVKTPSIETPVKYLSGGNIQKLIVSRELRIASKLIVAEQPTAGLDVKTSEVVHKTLKELASKGISILLISSDLDEILKLSDRIGVMFKGKIVKIFEKFEADPKQIGLCMLKGD